MRRALCILAALSCLVAVDARAQLLFGKNKVVYEDREWLVYEEDRLSVYFYPEEEELARFTLGVARETYAEFSAWFDYEFEEQIPLILYGTHHDLKQTHVIPSFVSEGTAGFTEFAKGRVALRATGNRAELRHLIRHEMVHAFMLAKLARVMTDRGIYDYQGPPLWFVEGLAESLANAEPDDRAHMIMRDAVLNDRLVPLTEMWRIWGTFQMYKQGESIVDFVRAQYGDRAPALLLEQWWRGRHFEEVLELELGLDLEELDQQWRTAVKRRYFPEMMRRRQIGEQATPVARDGTFDTMPSVVDASGDLELVCLSAREGTISLYHVRAGRNGKAAFEQLVEGGRDADFESMPLLRSRLDTHGRRWVAFVAKSGATDAVYVYDLRERDVVEEFTVDGATEISSPAFSPDGERIVVSGLDDDGWSDLYVVERATGAQWRVTDDLHHDTHADWHPGGDRLVFASDRHRPGDGRHGLYEIEARGRSPVRPLVISSGEDTEPVWSPDGRFLTFVSDRDGARNAYRYDPVHGTVVPLTNVTGGVFGPDVVPATTDSSDASVVMTVYQEGRFRLYTVDAEPGPGARSTEAIQELPASVAGGASIPELDTVPVPDEYEVDLGLDVVQSVVALDPDLPYGSGANFGFTDMLGNHRVSAYVGTATDEFDLEDLNLGLTYTDLGQRWNRRFGVFRVAVRQRLQSFVRVNNSEVRTGGFVGLTYPFSKFQRLELTAVARHLDRAESEVFSQSDNTTWLASGFVSLVHDNTLWTWNGPIRGMRANLTFGETYDLFQRGFDRRTLQLDVRRYDDLGSRIVLATRAQWRGNWGGDQQFFYLGGPETLRGYRRNDLAGDRTTLFSQELRFPLIERIALRFPIGPFELPPIRGVLFNDVARIDGDLTDTGWIGAFGYSASMTLYPPIVFRVDFVRRHDFDAVSGLDTDFYLGLQY